MKKALCIAMLLVGAVSASAQGSNGGVLYASDFANWSLPQANTPAFGQIQWTSSQICQVSATGYTFTGPKIGRPVRIIDSNSTLSETVTPTNVIVNGAFCSLSAPMANQHYTYHVASGTGGLQEAIDYQAGVSQGSVVILTPAWTLAGGTTGMITAATGNANVSILDERTNTFTAYSWNGSAYVVSPFITTGCLGGNSIANGCTGATTQNTAFNSIVGPGGTMTGTLNGTDAAFSSTVAAATALPLPYTTVTAWGDSLTCGVGAGIGSCSIYTLGTNTFPALLQALVPNGVTVLNRGIPSQTSSDVLIRMGMCPNGGPSYLPGSCVATLTSPLGTSAGSTATFTVPNGVLGYRACAFSAVVGIPVVINGIPGTCVDTSGNGLGTYTFTSTGTSAGLSTGTYNYNGNPPASELAGLNIIWVGTNNVFRPPTIVADVDTIVSGLPNGSDYVILDPLNQNSLDGWAGNKDNNTTRAIGASEWQHYSAHTLLVREALVNLGKNYITGMQQTDFIHDVTPYTYRGLYSPGTLVADITDTTSCTFTVSGTPTPLTGYVVQFDTEYIYVVTPGSVCIRGYGNSTAATHTAGATATEYDAVHLKDGYGNVAGWVNAWMQADAGATSAYLTPAQKLQNFKIATTNAQPVDYPSRYAFTINGFGDTFTYKAGNNAAHSGYGGINNTDVGPFAAYDNVSGSAHASFGVRAGEHLTGSNWAVFGPFACQKLADNSTNAANPTNIACFGRSTRILGANDTDTGAFGDGAIACGTHCYSFGSASATKVYMGQSQTSVGGTPVATAAVFATNLNLSGTNCSTGVVKGDGTGCVNPITTISMASAPGDLICAVGTSNSIPDTTIGQIAITAMSSDASTVTLTSAGFLGYRVGATINTAVTGTPAGLSGPFVIASITPVGSQTSMVLTSATNPCATGSCSGVGGTINELCSNSADATTFTSFANNYLNFPVSANTYAELKAMLGVYSPSVSPAPVNFHLLYNGTTVYANNTVFTPLTQSGLTPAYASMGWSEMGLSSTSAVFVPSEFVFPTASSAFLTGSRAAYGSISGLTSGLPVTFQVQFQATAIYSGTYTSGGSITSTPGQTCNLTSFNNGSTATATVLTGTNVIAGGTALTILTRGAGATAASTSATLSNGTATCSGTAVVATVLGAAPGNAVKVFAFGRTQ